LALANKFWRFAMAKRLVNHNPASGLKATEILAPSTERHYAAIIEPRAFGALRAIDSYAGQPVTRLALQLLGLTFVRTGELRVATWDEFMPSASSSCSASAVSFFAISTARSAHRAPELGAGIHSLALDHAQGGGHRRSQEQHAAEND
jgi:hypothetical protein